ncbi:ribosome silencing factor [Desulfoglaeba alkanexedens]|uniref:ribosome silencing factor n=1 Tax=Desulfoglaeba alkanexedens TaxID=361111 RepID=UPI001FE4331E|nr:ribosome silencing factor [Desulfoglaeba alkanexedens]
MKKGAVKELQLSALQKAVLCAREAEERKALNIVLLDVSQLTSFADYFVICSGKSSRQVQGIADHLEGCLREAGIRPLGMEGLKEGQWVLLDYGEVIVHIFYDPVRGFYDLESLWADARTVHLEGQDMPQLDRDVVKQ